MANIVRLKRSSVPGKEPNVADLEVGEIAVNLADGILYSKNTAGNVIVVGSSTTSNVVEGVNLYFTNTRAISAFTAGNNITIESNGQISATVTGGNGGGGGASVTISNTSPVTPSVGDLYWDEELLTLFIYYDDGDTQQWVETSPASGNNPFEFSKSIAGSETELFRFDATLYRGAKFIITLSDDPSYKIEEIMLIHDGTSVAISQPYLTDSQASLGSVILNYSSNIVGSNVIFSATPIMGAPLARGLVNLIRI